MMTMSNGLGAFARASMNTMGLAGDTDEDMNHHDGAVSSWSKEKVALETGSDRHLVHHYCEHGASVEHLSHVAEKPEGAQMLIMMKNATDSDYQLFSSTGNESEKNRKPIKTGEDDTFLLYAKSCDDGSFKIFLYPKNHECYHEDEPAYFLKNESENAKWSLIKCAPRLRKSAASENSHSHHEEILLTIDHYQEVVGEGLFNAIAAHARDMDGHSARVSGHQRISRASLMNAHNNPGRKSLTQSGACFDIATKKPKWNKSLQSLVLSFKGRPIKPSSRNFQIVLKDESGVPRTDSICQYGRLYENVYSLDIHNPLTAVQAFALAISSHYWT